MRSIGWASLAAIVLALTLTPPAHASPATDLPTRNTRYVTRDGSRLTLDGEPFRFAGTNIYWLGLDENVGGVAYPTFFRIRDALDTAKAMGMTVVRSHMLTSTGNPLSILPAKDKGFNEAAFATVDYAIAYAGSIGLRLVLPLTDEWSYYHGGHHDFTDPYGLPPEAFYTDQRVIADYQAYAGHLMRRVNPLTGRAYNADPTIMAWELGNELEGMTPGWINANAAVFRQWAPRQLIAAGRRFDIDPDTLAAPGVDIVDVHYYPPTAARVAADAATVTGAGKVYLAGEYASTAAGAELLTPLAADPAVTGMMSWSLFGHHDRGGFVQHDDGFTLHYPGDDERMRASVEAQIAFAGQVSPASARPTRVGPPLITQVDKRGGLNELRWRGAAGADGYVVERAAHGGWTPAHQGTLGDGSTPWLDTEARGDVTYRVVPIGRDGRRGTPSEPVRAGRTQIVLADPLQTTDLADGHAGITLTPAGATAQGAGRVSWSRPGLRRVRFDLTGRPRVRVQVSQDGAGWRTVRHDGGDGQVSADAGGAGHVRVLWSGGTLTRATLWAADPAPVTAPPAAPAPLTPAPGSRDVLGAPAFTWSPAAGAGCYTLTVSRNADLSDPVLTVTAITGTAITGTSHTPSAALDPGATYHWRVTAVNAAGSTAGPVASFTTRPLPTRPAVVDDFTGYADTGGLASAYVRNPNGDPITPVLDAGPAMRLDYTLGAAGYAGVTRAFAPSLDLWGLKGLELRLTGTGRPVKVTVQFVTGGVYFEHTLDAVPGGAARIPFAGFDHPSWAGAGPLDLTRFDQLSIYVGGGPGAGTLTVGQVTAYPGP
ncbi:glycoside hydrolase family 5 protein [Actinomadura sp. ATCC 31491]|uniref:mannan endo-1,4-beta-mannosidase n=1 Tax=Actinomadura luzonensis TaxID=2805427 RepID=A0ABT0FWR9_9ACTN|nr:cellulase family glycosylhydrolase [Actinomadura luzonensis]MCK2216331.1 glycoside hydrolase family 5 protein [Actinomadura luzonensis]